MIEKLTESEERLCRFPGCRRPAIASEGTGRPPEYCDDSTHTRGAAWRARQRLTGATPASRDEARPVDAARQRASEIRGQVAGMAELLESQLRAIVEELRIVADPEAAEAQLEAMSSETAEQVAAANARATRAEQAQRRAEAERTEADAAAMEATEEATALSAQLASVQEQLTGAAAERDLVLADLAVAQDAAAARERELLALVSQLEEGQALAQRLLEQVTAERDGALARADTARAAQAEAEERARGAVRSAEAETKRATRAEAATEKAAVRLEKSLAQVEALGRDLADLRAQAATLAAERDAARADAAREREHGDQRVGDLVAAHERAMTGLQADVERTRADAREQRTRADQAEAKLGGTPPAPGKRAPRGK